ncbi:MAG: CapA family protein [Lachnospiraceae bacterium]
MQRYRLKTGLMIVVILCMAASLTGCGQPKYERIGGHAENTNQMQDGAVADIRIAVEEDDEIAIVIPENQEDDTPEAVTGQEQRITLLFGGDVLLSEHILQAYKNNGGIGGVLDSGYRQAIAAADFFMVNQEFPFSNRGTAAADKQYTFRLAPEYVRVFQEMGIDGVTLANNHALDFGQEALLDSCETLDGAGIAYTGAGANLEQAKQAIIFKKNEFQIGVIGATRVIPESGWAAGQNHPGMLATYDPAILLKEIETLRQSCDYVIVYVHWGIERDENPQEYQRQLGRQYIDAGADLVIGSHPHVLQGIEYYQGKPVVYSLGNFVFGSSIPRTTLLKLTFEQDQEVPVLQLLPGTSGAGYTRMLTETDKLQEFYQYMESISFGVKYDNEGTVHSGE